MTRSEETSIVENLQSLLKNLTRGENKKMGNISLNEALGRRESELLSSMVGMSIDIESIEFESGKDKDGKDISKPTLLKPGAEKLCVLFNLDAQFNGDGNSEQIIV